MATAAPDYSGLNIDPSLAAGAIGFDATYDPSLSLAVPDTSGINLPGQLPGIPGGGGSNGGFITADGTSAVYTDPSVNPNPTGDYLSTLLKIANTGMQAFNTFVKGSPQVGIPPSKLPSGKSVGGSFLTTPAGGTNWWAVGGIALLGIAAAWLLVKYV